MPRFFRFAFVFAFVFACPPAFAQQTPEKQAEQLLTAARTATTAGDAAVAAQRFKEILEKFPNTTAAKHAKLGLALQAFNAPNADYAKVAEALTPLAKDGGFSDRGTAYYHLASALRMVGLKELNKPAGNSGEIQQRKQAADAKFEEARTWFESARDWYQSKKDMEWAGRARCDKAEMSIRLNKPKDARSACEVFTKDADYIKLKVRPLGLYFYGLACFHDNDLKSAGRTLNQLAPFTDPAVGLHARYLVGRVLHLTREPVEASVHYDAVIADYEKAKLAAIEAVKQPERFKANPLELARLRTLATGKPPEHVAGAAFHGANLSYEAGRFPEALVKLQQFVKTYPDDSLTPDAALRIGFCQVQQKAYEDAIKTLTPLVEQARLADQAQFWLGKAQFALALTADPAKPKEREDRLNKAIETLRAALAKAIQLALQNAPEAKVRKSEIMLELADSLHAVKKYQEAVPIYRSLWVEKLLPSHGEELLQRYAAVVGAIGEWDNSDTLLGEFRKNYSQSPLMPAVLFRHAENAYGRATTMVKRNAPPVEIKPRWEEAASRYKDVAEKYPESERANPARLGAGVCQLRLGNVEEAVKVLEAIPGPDRVGEIAIAAYLLADCYIRQAPAKAEDALQENQIREKLNAAVQMLEGFTGGPKTPETPAALMKLGLGLKRLGGNLTDANERNQTLNKARETYARVVKEYPGTPLAGQARLESIQVKVLQGDPNGAINDLKTFLQNDTTKNDKSAPLAALHLATMYRQQNNPAEAVKVLTEARQKYESAMQNDPERKEWVPLLKYHNGVALMEVSKAGDARPLFEQVAGQAHGKPMGAEAALRIGQCQVIEARKLIQDGNKARAEASNDNGRRNNAENTIRRGYQVLNQAADVLMNHANGFKSALPNSEARARMLYDAAWVFRELAQDEFTSASQNARKALHTKLVAEAMKKLPPNSPEPAIPLSEIDRSKVPPTKSELRAFNSYTRLIEEYAEASIAVDARFELAEWKADRGDHADAARLLKAALDAQPSDKPVPPDTLERIRMRLGASYFAIKEYKPAAAQFEAIMANPKSGYYAQAVYRSGECLSAAGEYEKAVTRLAVFRDKKEFQNIGGISDRALLRLGLALIAAKNLDAGRDTLGTLLERFPNSPYAPDARYGFAQILQSQGKLDEAIKAYEAVIAATKAEVAAKACIQIGECRMAQKKYADAAIAFLIVPSTYDYPEVANAAILEAARAFVEDGKPDQAARLLQKLVDSTPEDSPWHKAAKERLEKLPAAIGTK